MHWWDAGSVTCGAAFFRHDAIASSSSIQGEAVIGWGAHYLIGIAFTVMLVVVYGADWLERPTLGPALTIGLGTVCAPLLLMQPGMGAGIAASRTKHPWSARLQSIIMHLVFGLGLYAAARLVQWS